MTPVGGDTNAEAAVHRAGIGFAAAVETYLEHVAAGRRFEAAEVLGDADRHISAACWAAGIHHPDHPDLPHR